MVETENADAIRLIHDKVNEVNASLPRPDRQKMVRFDGIGDLTLSMTAADLQARGFVNEGNLYSGMDASCVSYARAGSPVSASIDSATGRVLALGIGTDFDGRTMVGRIGAGSTLTQVRAAFDRPGYELVEQFDLDFGQGSNGVIVEGPGGAIGLGLSEASGAAYADGSVTVNWVAGVGIPGNAPSAMESGC